MKDGWIRNTENALLVDTMKEWVLTTEIRLETAPVEVTDEKRNENDPIVAWIDNDFSIDAAGDYSIERIYAKLSSLSHGFI